MRNSVLLKVVFVAGIVLSPVRAVNYLSTEIAKGNSWRYLITNGPNNYGLKTTTITDYTIDSVWGAAADTLFFRVSERDSVSWTNSPSVPDSGYVASLSLLCKKADGVTVCDSFTVSRLFNDVAAVEVDSQVMMNGTIYSSNFSRPVDIEFNLEQVNGVQTGSFWTGIGTHFGSIADTVLCVDGVGIVRQRSIRGGGYPSDNYDRTTTLLRYNGSDVSFSFNVASVRNRVVVPGTAPMMMKRAIGRNNLEPGFNLLGQMIFSESGGFGIRILKRPMR